jgi:hypothetical protein
VLTGVAITTTRELSIQQVIVITMKRTITTTTSVSVPHSNIISDYIFYGIYTVKY